MNKLAAEAKAWFRATAQATSVLLLLSSVCWYCSTFSAKTAPFFEELVGYFFFSVWGIGICTVAHIWKTFGMPRRAWFWEHGFMSQFRGLPEWFPYCWCALFALLLIHLALLAFNTSKGFPVVVNGEYVLQFRGQLHELVAEQGISEARYFALQAPETRLIALMNVSCSFFSFVYWWFGSGSDRPSQSLIVFD